METIYSLVALPPTIGKYTFTEEHFTNTVLNVPQGSRSTYEDAYVWFNFFNIKEFDTTDISSVTIDNGSKRDVIYDLNGRRLNAPQRGINIINGKKVIVK